MSTAIDTNILVSLWSSDDALNVQAEHALGVAARRNGLLIAAPVYVELRAMAERTERMVDEFLRELEIEVDWVIDERIWREAAKATHEYGRRRQEQKLAKPSRRIAGDYVIGAHAMVRGHSLLTLDHRTFRIAFPLLRMAPENF